MIVRWPVVGLSLVSFGETKYHWYGPVCEKHLLSRCICQDCLTSGSLFRFGIHSFPTQLKTCFKQRIEYAGIVSHEYYYSPLSTSITSA